MRNTRFSGPALLALVAVAATLGGCRYNDMALDDAYVPSQTAERYPIEYAKGPIVLEVQTAAGSLQPEQVNAVAGFARQSMAGGLTPVTIRRPAGGGASLKRVAEEVAGPCCSRACRAASSAWAPIRHPPRHLCRFPM
ncbi:MAG: CpaD family pilus assembly lipoprotein [Hyphomicrobiales bacterium]